MSLKIIRNDISKVSADAIVNTANPFVEVGDGVDNAIYEAAGKEALLEERRKIGNMAPGDAAYTPAFDLDARYIIHTVGPVWNGGDSGEKEILASCYRKSLDIARDLGCESVAFPLMSAGTYGFPKDVALKEAVGEISDFLFKNEMEVYLVVYDKESFEVSGKAFDDIKAYIGDDDVREVSSSDRRVRRWREAARIQGGRHAASVLANMAENIDPEELANLDLNMSLEPDELPDYYESVGIYEHDEGVEAAEAAGIDEHDEGVEAAESAGSDEHDEGVEATESAGIYEHDEGVEAAEAAGIDELIGRRDLTWQEYLFRLIDRKGLDDKDVYKKANIDRKHFSKIKSNADYNPSKKTAIAFAIALELNLDETKDMLRKAGIALTRSSIFDIIIEYCINNEIRDIHQINCFLFDYDQPLLGL